MSIRNRLFLTLFLLASVPLLVLLFGIVNQEEKEIERRSEQEIFNSLAKTASELQSLIDSQRAQALGLSKVPLIHDFAHKSPNATPVEYNNLYQGFSKFLLEYQASVASVQGLRYIDKRGKTLIKVKEGKLIPPQFFDKTTQHYYVADQRKKEFFKSAMQSKSDVDVSNFELGQVDVAADFCPAMLRYSIPVRDNGETIGLFVVNMWGTRIDNLVEATMVAQNRDAYIVEISDELDRDSIYLYHKNDELRFSNQLGTNYKFTQEIGKDNWSLIKASTSDHGSIVLNDSDIYFYKKIRPYDSKLTEWLLITHTTKSDILATTVGIKKTIFYLLGVLLIFVIISTTWISILIASPVQNLAKKIKLFADGDRSIRYVDKRRDEIGEAGKAFNYLAENLAVAEEDRDKAAAYAAKSEKLAALGQLAAGIGHEINNPLQNILSLSSLIHSNISSSDNCIVEEDLRLLKKESKRCANIVQGILNFARESELSYEKIDIASILDDTLNLMKHKLDVAKIKIISDYDGPIFIEGDGNKIQQVFVNLILNSIYATPSDGVITVRANIVGENVKINIIDSGDGISESEIDKVFNPFYTTKGEGEGTGLGLSVTYGIVKKHGGYVSLENMKPKGVDATVVFPISYRNLQSHSHYEQAEEQYAG